VKNYALPITIFISALAFYVLASIVVPEYILSEAENSTSIGVNMAGEGIANICRTAAPWLAGLLAFQGVVATVKITMKSRRT
jgi:hypothetical protein